ncbi:MAG TPA: MotA/TolQ/ExbB proton channel family protein, partial [Planctomycetota bacterium]|nr:MotA/TolQ/ExbB proton channel family protein [Planctomycetota bacterium]
GVHQIPHGPAAVEKTVQDAAEREAGQMRRSLRPLSAVAQLAPLLGLLGTVYGMITAFQAASAAGVGKGEQLAAGIYEALVTTAAGLTVAIPALLAHQILSGKIDRLLDLLEKELEGVLDEVRLRARSREPRRSGP